MTGSMGWGELRRLANPVVSCLGMSEIMFFRLVVACDMQSRIFGVKMVCFASQGSQIERVRQFLRVLSAVHREGRRSVPASWRALGVPWSAPGPALELPLPDGLVRGRLINELSSETGGVGKTIGEVIPQ